MLKPLFVFGCFTSYKNQTQFKIRPSYGIAHLLIIAADPSKEYNKDLRSIFITALFCAIHMLYF